MGGVPLDGEAQVSSLTAQSGRFEVYFTLTEVATRLSKSVEWTRDRAKAREFGEVFLIGRDWMVTESGLLAYLERHRVDLSTVPTEERRAEMLSRFQREVPATRDFTEGIKASSIGMLRRKAADFSPVQAPGQATNGEVCHG